MGFLDELEALKQKYSKNISNNVKVPSSTEKLVCQICANSKDPKIKRTILSFGNNPNIREVTCDECGTTYVKDDNVSNSSIIIES